jgi:hypothetical protein
MILVRGIHRWLFTAFPGADDQIDKSFISEVGKGGKETDIIRAMIVMPKIWVWILLRRG